MYVVCRPGLVILWVRFSAAFRTSLRFIGSVRKLVNHTSHSFCAMGWCARVLAVYSSCLRMCSACSAARFYEAFRSSAALNSASRFSAAAFACAAAVSRTLCCSTVRLNLISLRPVPASRCRRVSTIPAAIKLGSTRASSDCNPLAVFGTPCPTEKLNSLNNCWWVPCHSRPSGNVFLGPCKSVGTHVYGGASSSTIRRNGACCSFRITRRTNRPTSRSYRAAVPMRRREPFISMPPTIRMFSR